MGYRSEVAFKCTPEAHNILLAVADFEPTLKEMLKECENVEVFGGEFQDPDMKPNTPGAYFWSHTKWYETYKEISTFETVMQLLENMGLEQEFGFIRIGEELDDYEMRGDSSAHNMYIHRSIEL